MSWMRSDTADFRAMAMARPGWYWVLRPRQVGPRAYDPSDGILCLVLVQADGTLLSPLADLNDLSADDLICVDADSGVRFPTWFSGPVSAGALTSTVRPSPDHRPVVTGEPLVAPGWYWCRTNDAAPLALIDDTGAGPIFLEEDASGELQVYLACTVSGASVDVGEFGFAEPLVSAGGVIDSSGSLGRNEAFFHGRLSVPEGVPSISPRG